MVIIWISYGYHLVRSRSVPDGGSMRIQGRCDGRSRAGDSIALKWTKKDSSLLGCPDTIRTNSKKNGWHNWHYSRLILLFLLLQNAYFTSCRLLG